MATSEASQLLQKFCCKSGKAKTGGLHSAFFNATKALPSQYLKFQGTSHYNKVDKGAAIFVNFYIKQLH